MTKTDRQNIKRATFIPPPILGLLGWAHYGAPGAWAGAAAAIAACLVLWPVLVAVAVFGIPPALGAALSTRSSRAADRKAAKRAAEAAGHAYPREHIPAWLDRAAWAAGHGTCAYCGQLADALDHIWPWAAGGLHALFNLMPLCEACNQVKSDYCVHPSGYVEYNPFGRGDEDLAARIARRERWKRWWLPRYAYALAAL